MAGDRIVRVSHGQGGIHHGFVGGADGLLLDAGPILVRHARGRRSLGVAGEAPLGRRRPEDNWPDLAGGLKTPLLLGS